jgi:hypothetical protein
MTKAILKPDCQSPAKQGLLQLSLWCLGLFWLVGTPATAHEFWIEPSTFQPQIGDTITADLVIGTDFLGASAIYVPDQIERFAVIAAKDDAVKDDAEMPITGRYGDRPAGTFTVNMPGVHIILHQTAPLYLTYASADKFTAFVTEKGYPEAVAQHRRRGLLPDKITERYQRFAKSLITVGPAARNGDKALGLRYEVLAETNPYRHPAPATMTVRVLAAGMPVAGTQVTVFTRHNPRRVDRKNYITNGAGRIEFAVQAGRDYLVDAVRLLPIDDAAEPRGAVWESLWASLVFHVPPAGP